MPDQSEHKRRAAETFSAGSSNYVESDVHRRGDDLEQLAQWVWDSERILDVATGAGHTAGAIREESEATIVAADAAPGMVQTAIDSFDGLVGVLADAENLPFASGTFDGVTCRIAAHHFPDPESFVEEVARVLTPDGAFAFEDNIAPADPVLDDFLNSIERLRDPTHVRSYTETEWREWLDNAGFRVKESFVIQKEIQYDSWIEQLDTPQENREQLRALFRDPPIDAGEVFSIRRKDGQVRSFSNLKLVLLAVPK